MKSQELILLESCKEGPREMVDPNLLCLNKFLLKIQQPPRPQAQSLAMKVTKRYMRTHLNEVERKAVRHVKTPALFLVLTKKE